MSSSFIIKNKKHLCALILIILIFLVYSNTLNSPFVMYDDQEYVVNNPYIKNITIENIRYIFENQYASNYHPIHLLSYMLEYSIWGPNPFGYHLTNIVLFITIVLIIFFSILKITDSINISFSIALIYGLHPVHTESVSWVASRNGVLSASFVALSWFFFTKYLNSQRRVFYLFAILLFIFAMLSKIVVFPFPILITIILFFYKDKFERLKFINDRVYLKLLPRTLILVLPFFIIAIILTLPTYLSRSATNTIRGYPDGSIYYMFLTQMTIVVKYIKLIFLPHPQSLIYHIRPVKSFFDPLFLLSFTILTVSLSFSFFLLIKHKIRLGIFTFIFFFSALLPYSNILPLSNLMCERYLLIPSIPFISIPVFVTDRFVLSNKIKSIMLLFVVFTFGLLTISRNYDWRDDYTLWNRTVELDPGNPYALNNLGAALADMGYNEEALNNFKMAEKIMPLDNDAFLNHVHILFLNKNLISRQAKAIIDDISVNINDKIYLTRLANFFYKTKQYEIADVFYRRIFYLHNDDIDILLKWAATSLYIGNFKAAKKRILIAEHIDKEYRKLEFTMGLVYYLSGDYRSAQIHFLKELSRYPNCEECYELMKNINKK